MNGRRHTGLLGSLPLLLGLAGCEQATRRDGAVDAVSDAYDSMPSEAREDAATDARDGTAVDAGSDALGADASGSGCNPTDAGGDRQRAFLDMRITGGGFEAHEGAVVRLYTSRGVLDEVFGDGERTIVNGAFVFDFPSGYERGRVQSISWFVDTDGDHVCNAAVADHVGYLRVGPFDPPTDNTIEVTVSDNHTPAVPSPADACVGITAPLHDLEIVGSGFADHDGLTVHLVTSSPYNGRVLGAGQAIIVGGAFAFYFPKGFERTTYQEILWFTDLDRDGRCTPNVDHTGYVATPAFTPLDASASVRMPITDGHGVVSARGEDVCAVLNGCRPSR